MNAGFGIGLLAAAVLLAAPAAHGQGGAASEESMVVFKVNDRPVAEYRMAEDSYKPFFQALRTPAGVNVVRDRPHDHIHHHGLMMAINVDGVQFWAEEEKHGVLGKQRYAKGAENGSGPLDWIRVKDREVIVKEQRSLELLDPAEAGASVLKWESVFTLPEGKQEAVFKGSHYHGLGVRFVEAMDGSEAFFFAEGAQDSEHVRGSEYLTRAKWCAYHAEAEGKPVTVAMFDAPDNPRHPAWWFTMYEGFSYMSATLNTYREPYTLKAGERLRLRYGVALWDGHVDRKEIERIYALWLK